MKIALGPLSQALLTLCALEKLWNPSPDDLFSAYTTAIFFFTAVEVKNRVLTATDLLHYV